MGDHGEWDKQHDPAHHYRVQYHNRDSDEHAQHHHHRHRDHVHQDQDYGDHHPAHHHRDVCDVDDCHRSGGFRWALLFPCSPGGACGLCGSSCAVIAPRVPAVTEVQPTFLVLAERASAGS